ncbi:capsule assembly Wzi family protein [Balneolales bacterium ANBcel1]|nr:capsule assembly Wzi family protein [Balneolales bacterium ANBcel1]
MRAFTLFIFLFFHGGMATAATNKAPDLPAEQENPYFQGAGITGTEEPGAYSYGWMIRAAASTAGPLPFWIHSNRLGTLDQESANLATHLFGSWSHRFDSGIHLKAGGNLLLRAAASSDACLQEAYLEAGYSHFILWAGRKRENFGMVHPHLSMGTTDLSHNARPIPKITFETDGFQQVPGTRRVLNYKAGISHGWMNDTNHRFVDDVWLHQKYLYLQIFSDDAPVVGRGGLKHFAQWGGDSPVFGRSPKNLRAFRDVFFSLAADSKEIFEGGELLNSQQNHMGSYDFNLRLNLGQYRVSISRQFILEDTPNARFGTPWDGLWGAYVELRPDSRTRWRSNLPNDRVATPHRPLLRAVHYEYLDTKEGIPRFPHRDMTSYFNYYNHSSYRGGWTYYGRSLGNPLFFGDPDYLGVVNNIIIAHHAGAMGHAGPIDWRVFTTYSRNYGAGRVTRLDGTRVQLPNERRDQWSFMLELETGAFHPSLVAGAALALDTGEVYKDNLGLMISLRWTAR